MQPTTVPRIKICCISSDVELDIAVQAGANLVGLVSSMPSGPGVIDDALIVSLVRRVPVGVTSVLLTSRQSADSIVAQHRLMGTGAIQIVDTLTHGTYSAIREGLPGVRILQVIHVTGPQSVDEALAIAAHVDAILLDSGNPGATVRELGGTGRRHDWSVSRRIREQVGVPVYLAGGLNPGSAREAIEEVAPFGLDVCTGVRTNGALDRSKVEAFVRAASVASTERDVTEYVK